jgi:hypothetical protein
MLNYFQSLLIILLHWVKELAVIELPTSYSVCVILVFVYSGRLVPLLLNYQPIKTNDICLFGLSRITLFHVMYQEEILWDYNVFEIFTLLECYAA